MPPPDDLLIRTLHADEIDVLTELLHRAYAHLLAAGLRYTASYQDPETTRRRIAGAECYVGELDGRIVASVTFHPPERAGGASWYDRPDVATFSQLCVDPSLRRRGIAAMLLDLVERRAAETGAAEIACDTAEPAHDLIAMYTARGYRIVEKVSWKITNYESVILSKAVAPTTPSRGTS